MSQNKDRGGKGEPEGKHQLRRRVSASDTHSLPALYKKETQISGGGEVTARAKPREVEKNVHEMEFQRKNTTKGVGNLGWERKRGAWNPS